MVTSVWPDCSSLSRSWPSSLEKPPRICLIARRWAADELEAWFKVEGSHVKRIDLNRATVQEMGRHPYIGFTRARAIENYRRNQGRIKSIDDLCLLEDFTQEARDRMEPYVGF